MAVDYTFQNKVNVYPPIGEVGGYASVNPIISTPLGYIAKTSCPIGGFVWEDSSDKGQVNPSGSGQPLGFVVREVNVPMGTNVAYTNAVAVGCTVTVAVEGDFYASPSADSTKGQKVFVSTLNGTLKGGTAGATVSNHVETNWVFMTDADAGEVGIISNFGQRNVVVPAEAIDLSSYETSAHASTTYSTIANTVTNVEAGTGAGKVKVTKNGASTEFTVPTE